MREFPFHRFTKHMTKMCSITHALFKSVCCPLQLYSFIYLFLRRLQLSACLRLECVGRYGPQAHTPSHRWGWERGRKRHPCRDHFEICEDFRAIWTRCQSAPDSKGWQRYPTVQYGSLFNELLTVPRFNWCDIWAIYLWHFNEGWFSALPFTFFVLFSKSHLHFSALNLLFVSH